MADALVLVPDCTTSAFDFLLLASGVPEVADLGWSKRQGVGDHPEDSSRSDRQPGLGCPRRTYSNRKASRV